MVHIGLLLGAILVATASLSGTAAAQERQLGSDGDVTFGIPVQYRCGTTAPVTVTAPDASLFTQDQVRLQRLLGLIRIALGFECPTVSTIEISGLIRGRHVYSGIASAGDGWRLASAQDAAVGPSNQPVRVSDPTMKPPVISETNVDQTQGIDRQDGSSWVGVFHSYPHFVTMGLDLPPLGHEGTVEVRVEMRLEPLVNTRSIARSPMGMVDVNVRYDPLARTVEITPAPNALRAVGVRLPNFSGVVDVENQLIGGILVGASATSSPYFVLSRAEFADAAFVQTLRRTVSAAQSRTPPPKVPASGPNAEKLLEWAGQLLTEYPDLDPYRTESGELWSMARHLFRDGYFRPFFGKTFDELERADLQQVLEVIRRIPRPRANFPEERANGAVRAVERGFTPMIGTFAAPDIVLSVIALRPIDAWRMQSLWRLETATGIELKTLSSLERAESQVLRSFWPSERKALGDTLVSSRGRVAISTLASRVDELLTETTSFDSVPRILEVLKNAPPAIAGVSKQAQLTRSIRSAAVPGAISQDDFDNIPALMALVPAEVGQAQLALLESQVDELVSDEARRDLVALTGFGTGLNALQVGAEWYVDSMAKYGAVPSHSAVQGVLKEFAKQRSHLLKEMEAILAHQIRAASSILDLNDLRTAYLSVPFDESDFVGKRLLDLAQVQDAQLRQAEKVLADKDAVETERRKGASMVARDTTPATMSASGRAPAQTSDEGGSQSAPASPAGQPRSTPRADRPFSADEFFRKLHAINDADIAELEKRIAGYQEELKELEAEDQKLAAANRVLYQKLGATGTAFDSSGFMRPALLNHVYRGRFENLERETFSVEYLYKFTEVPNRVCPGSGLAQALLQVGKNLFDRGFDSQSRDATAQQAMQDLVEMMRNPGRMMQLAAEKDQALKNGTEDAMHFLRRYACDHPVSKRMFANLDSVLKGQPAVYVDPRVTEISPAAKSAIAPPTIEVGKVFTSILYGEVPEEFVPEMPSPNDFTGPYVIYMEKEDVGALTRIAVTRLVPSIFGLHQSRVMTDPFAEDLSAVQREIAGRSVVLECSYVGASARSAMRVVPYWYKKMPAAADPTVLRGKAADHPLLYVRAARSECPPWYVEK